MTDGASDTSAQFHAPDVEIDERLQTGEREPAHLECLRILSARANVHALEMELDHDFEKITVEPGCRTYLRCGPAGAARSGEERCWYKRQVW